MKQHDKLTIMSEINLLADKIEQVIVKMFTNTAEQKSGMWNYALLFNSKKITNMVYRFIF
jgi:hypothetical protein